MVAAYSELCADLSVNRSGKPIATLTGEVLECVYLRSNRVGAGSDIALVELENGETVKVLTTKCCGCIGKTKQVLKKKTQFSRNVFYEFIK